MTSRNTLGRRSLLRGMLYGSAIRIGLPTLEMMLNSHGTALADGATIPKRFGIFFWGNGVRLKKWVPSAQGPSWQLSEELAPLLNVKDYVSVASGYNIKTGNERGHHAGCVGILSGAPMIPQDPKGAPYASTFSAPSIDQVVAASITDKLKFRSLEIGISKSVVTGEGTTLRYLSHNGPDTPNPPEYTPSALYSRLFGDGFKEPGQSTAVDPKLALRRSVLSAVKDDATALKRRLGVNDQRRIDQHMESIRALETQIMAIENAPPPALGCKKPTAPSTMTGDKYLTAVNDAMSAMAALALACDQTRVFSVMFSGSVGFSNYPEIQLGDHHSLTHNEGGEQPQVNSITVFIMQRFAKLLETLKATPEGTGNLLDSCVILGSTDTAEGLPHTINDYPILIAGKGGGTLVHPGIHVRSSGGNTSDVLLTLLQAVGLPLTEFGTKGGKTSTPVAALRA
ncbi:MAG TPA: DUF1552 domain-containing protein [Polyangiales bacterium]|nr:DUF1552 domain-containing protein [Polyangiales bacterium]